MNSTIPICAICEPDVSSNVVVDDHLLRDILLKREPAEIRRIRGSGRLFTTGSWYYRLCGALQEPGIVGVLSGPIAELPVELRAAVTQHVAALPAEIGLLSLRDVGWAAAGIGRRHGLNLLAAEALASAIATRSALAMARPNVAPRLVAAAERDGVRLVP